MNDTLSQVLQAVLIAVVPIVTAFIANLLKHFANNIASKTQSQKADQYIMEISDAVAAAVNCVSQTYVDTLKKSGEFTEENQKEALNLAYKKALQGISVKAADFINTLTDDVKDYLLTLIEAEIKNQKQ